MDNSDYEDFSFQNINSIIHYVKNNLFQFILLILVFVIIFVVDYISNINTIIFAIPSPIPGLTTTHIPPIQHIKENSNKIKKGKKFKNFKK
jgi:hypothetical protein